MVLNRKSAKITSRISLLIAVAMITTVFAVVQTHGYPIDMITENGIQVCRAGVVDLVVMLLW